MGKLRISNLFEVGNLYHIITKYKEIPIRANLRLNWVDDEGRLLGFDWGKTHLKGAFSTLDPVYIAFKKDEYAVTSVFSNMGKELVLMLETFTEPPDFVRRRSVRVEPDDKKPIEVRVKVDNVSITAPAKDISEMGVGVSLPRKEYKEFIRIVGEKLNHIEEDETLKFQVSITLPECGTIAGQGRLKNFIGKGTDVYVRLGFEVSFAKEDLNKIRKYVITRQREIIKSLRMVE